MSLPVYTGKGTHCISGHLSGENGSLVSTMLRIVGVSLNALRLSLPRAVRRGSIGDGGKYQLYSSLANFAQYM